MADVFDGRAELGQRGELLVARYLEAQGFTILVHNLRVGRLEIDLVARRQQLLVFCEVRTRTSDAVMTPAQSIDRAKTQRIRRAAAQWLTSAQLGPVDVRFDAAAVVFDTPRGRISYYAGAF